MCICGRRCGPGAATASTDSMFAVHTRLVGRTKSAASQRSIGPREDHFPWLSRPSMYPRCRLRAVRADGKHCTDIPGVTRPRDRAAMLCHLQAGKGLVWPGGWHSAPGSCGPLWLFPGPKSGSATAAPAPIISPAAASVTTATRFILSPSRFRDRYDPWLTSSFLAAVFTRVSDHAMCSL